MGIKHNYVSAIPDVNDPTKVRPSNWNDDHTIDGDVDFNGFDITNAGNFGASAGEFTSLGDVPNSYAGAGGKVVTVNGGETGLEFTVAGVGGDTVLSDWVTPMQYGAVADGTSHPLSEFYGDLVTAQAAYDGAFHFITSLTQQMDYAASKAAANECFGADLDYDVADFAVNGAIGARTGNVYEIPGGTFAVNELIGQTLFIQFQSNLFVVSSPITSNTADTITTAATIGGTAFDSRWIVAYGEHGNLSQLNKTLYFPAGTYMFANDTLLIRNLRSGKILGAGKLVTTLKANDIVMAFDGIWYTTISNMAFFLNSSGGTACLELDGNVPSHSYTTRGVQSVTCQDVFCYAAGSLYGVTMIRQGGSGGQGSECMFINCHMQGASYACYYQSGFNALANTIMGGNFQDYTKHGIYCNGNISVFNTGFQSTHLFDQYTNDGYDIYIGDFGAYEACAIYGCRTEGFKFLFTGAVTADVRAVVGHTAMQSWNDLTTYGSAIDGREIIMVGDTTMVATISGTSGASEPTWPATGSGGTVVDGTVTWTEAAFPYVNVALGSVDVDSVHLDFGKNITCPNTRTGATGLMRRPSSDDAFGVADSYLLVNTSGGAVAIGAPEGDHGTVATVIRRTANNALTFHSNQGSPETGNTNLVMPLGEYGYRSYVRGQDSAGVERWLLINTRFLRDLYAPTATAIGANTVTGYITLTAEGGGTIKLAVVS